MEKQRIGAAILLTFSLVSAAAAVANKAESAILLPSDGKEKFVAAVRPWTCCDLLISHPHIPPQFFCDDKVQQCADACNYCVEDEDNPSLNVCKDLYTGNDPGPPCTEEEEGNGIPADLNHNRVMPSVEKTMSEKTKGEEEEEGPPWKCCVRIFCRRSLPPYTCRCMDTVQNCSSACKSCEKVTGGYVCNDWYKGEFEPGC